MNIRDYLQNNILLFDGSMGTYVTELFPDNTTPCEMLNLTRSEEILNIHKEYVSAGAAAVKTNTFCANRKSFSEEDALSIIEQGYLIAKKSNAQFIFADIGPISVTDNDSLFEEYRFVADKFLSLGCENFLFETQNRLTALPEIARYIKEKAENAFIIISFASLPDGFTRSGKSIKSLIREAAASDYVDCVGLNCVCGARHMVELVKTLGSVEKPLSVMPNVGYPTVLGNRTYYNGNKDYFSSQLRSLVKLGVKITGGCCGTTPQHIAASYKSLNKPFTVKEAAAEEIAVSSHSPDIFWDKLCDANQKPIAVELDPPDNADITKFVNGAAFLKQCGVDVITIADCPIARAKMDSSLLACKLKREMDITPLPHMTCRDRNLNATKALLLGLCAEGIRNVLIVTGDPVPSENRDEVKSVYNFNSRMLVSYIKELGESTLPSPFRVFGALNLNAKNFSMQLKLAKEKVKNGICGFLTQPVLTQNALDNLILAHRELDAKILGGIMPIVSHKNALYMNSEVNGIDVDEKIISMYEGLSREEGEELAVKISVSIANKISPYVDGYYLMTPFNRTRLIGRIIDEIK